VKSYVWDEKAERFVERPPSDPTRHADRVEAEAALSKRAAEQRERDAHPGNYL